MLGLGDLSEAGHREIGNFLVQTPSISQVVFVGNYMKHAAHVAPAECSVILVPTWKEALEVLEHKWIKSGACFGLKVPGACSWDVL